MAGKLKTLIVGDSKPILVILVIYDAGLSNRVFEKRFLGNSYYMAARDHRIGHLHFRDERLGMTRQPLSPDAEKYKCRRLGIVRHAFDVFRPGEW